MGRPEGYVEEYLVEKSEEHGCLCYKWVSPGRRGVPDRILIGHGHVIFVELKSSVGQLSKSQQLMIPRLREHGADVRVIRSRSEVDALMRELED